MVYSTQCPPISYSPSRFIMKLPYYCQQNGVAVISKFQSTIYHLEFNGNGIMVHKTIVKMMSHGGVYTALVLTPYVTI